MFFPPSQRTRLRWSRDAECPRAAAQLRSMVDSRSPHPLQSLADGSASGAIFPVAWGQAMLQGGKTVAWFGGLKGRSL